MALHKKGVDKICLLALVLAWIIGFGIQTVRAQQIGVIGSVDTPGMAEGVWIEGNRVYVADGSYGLQIIDINDPSKGCDPLKEACKEDRINQRIPITSPGGYAPGFTSKIWIEGNFAYVADGPSDDVTKIVQVIKNGEVSEEEKNFTVHGFRIVDLTTGQIYELEQETDKWPIIPDHATDVEIVAGFAYVADQKSGLHIVNIQNLPGWYIAMLDTPGSAEAVAVENKMAFVADGEAGLQIVDVIKPLRPVIIGSVDTPGHAEGVAIKDNLAFVGDGPGGGLQIINISNPRQPRIIASVATPGRARGVEVLGNLVFVASGTAGIQVVDITNLEKPSIIASFDTPHFAVDLKIKNNLAYIADNLSGLQIADISGLFGPFISFSPLSGKVSIPMYFSFTIGDLNGLNNIDFNSFRLLVNNGELSFNINDLTSLVNRGAVTVKSSDVAAVATVPDVTLPFGATTNIKIAIADREGRLTSNSVDYQVVNRQPAANPGSNQSVKGGSTVTLDGSSSSDPDGSPLVFSWSQVSGPSVTLSDSTAKKPTFTAPEPSGDNLLTFRLVVNDGTVNSKPASVNIRINRTPVSDAGADQKVKPFDTVTLDGSGSKDPDGDSLTAKWVQTSGPTVTLSRTDTMNPTFVAPRVSVANNVLTFQLIVNDGTTDSQPDTVNISVNRPPIANAGTDQTAEAYALVTLDGSGSSDPDSDPLTYQWTQIAGTKVTLANATGARPTFFAPRAKRDAVLTFSLIINDGSTNSEPDTVSITIPGKP